MYASLALFIAVIAPLPSLMRSMAQRVTPFRVVANGVIAGAVGALVVMVLAQIAGTNVFEQLREQTQLAIQAITSTPEMAEALGGEASTAELTNSLTAMYENAIQLLPSTICVIAAIASYIEYIILSKIYKPGGLAAIPMTKMREYNLPRNIVTVWLVLYLISLLFTSTDGAAADFVVSNIVSIFNMLFMLQGMSLVFMLCYTKRIPKVVAVVIILVLMGMNFGNLALEMAGFKDVLFGIKQRLKQKAA